MKRQTMKMWAPVLLAAGLAWAPLSGAVDLGTVNNSSALPSVLPGGDKPVGTDAYWGGGANSTTLPDGETWSLDQLQADHLGDANTTTKDAVPRIRAAAIRDAAAEFGAQAGLAHEAKKINAALVANDATYDRIFNFSAIELEPGLLPPVISEGRNTYNQPASNEVRAADYLYKIEFPARFQNVPPTWRDYLMLPFTSPALPDKSLLPKTTAEKALWDEWVNKGWKQGQQQAWDTFETARGRLKRDFEGMVRYKALYEEGLVEKPIVARSNLGVTGGQDQMSINDRVVEITKPAALNPDSKRWLPGAPQAPQ